MKIIKPGDIRLLEAPRFFTCGKCGCVFECTKEEYVSDYNQHDGASYYATCPTCQNTVYAH